MSQSTHEHLIPTAKEALGVPGDASLSDCKQAFLWRLEEEEFIPSLDLIEAAGLLGVVETNSPSFSTLQSRFEYKLNQKMDEFLGDYWSLNPETRRAEWERLNDIAQTLPRQRLRLSELKHGLDAEIPADEDGIFEPVIRCVERAYLAPATMRQQMVGQIAAETDTRLLSMKLQASAFATAHPVVRQVVEKNDSRLRSLNKLAIVFVTEYPKFEAVFKILDIGDEAKHYDSKPNSDERRRKIKTADSDESPSSVTYLLNKKQHKGFAWYLVLFVVIGILKILLSRDSIDPPKIPTNSFNPRVFDRTSPPTMPMFKNFGKDRILNPDSKLRE